MRRPFRFPFQQSFRKHALCRCFPRLLPTRTSKCFLAVRVSLAPAPLHLSRANPPPHAVVDMLIIEDVPPPAFPADPHGPALQVPREPLPWPNEFPSAVGIDGDSFQSASADRLRKQKQSSTIKEPIFPHRLKLQNKKKPIFLFPKFSPAVFFHAKMEFEELPEPGAVRLFWVRSRDQKWFVKIENKQKTNKTNTPPPAAPPVGWALLLPQSDVYLARNICKGQSKINRETMDVFAVTTIRRSFGFPDG